MSAPQPPGTASIKVLRRADADASPADSPTGSPTAAELGASLADARQRLEQSKAHAAGERKKLQDELRVERAGRERAEGLLVKQAAELASTKEAQARLQEAFSRSMSELRYTRLEAAQAEQTIQALLRELMTLREHMREVQSHSALLQLAAASPGHSRSGSGAPGEPASGSSGAALHASGSSGCLAASNAKRLSKGKLIGELQQLRAAKAAEESRSNQLRAALHSLAAQKERAEEGQEMLSQETSRLLADKSKLLHELGSKDDVVRALEAGLDHLQHQLELALADRQLLLGQFERVADGGETEALAAALSGEQLGDGGLAAAGLTSPEPGSSSGGGAHEQQQQQQPAAPA